MLKSLPTAVDQERHVLGAALCFCEIMHGVRFVLEDDDFALEKHRIIWRAMCKVYDSGASVDRMTTMSELMDRKQDKSVDGLSYLITLDNGIPETPHVDSYVKILKEKSALRKIIYAAHSLMGRAELAQEQSQDILDSLVTMGSSLVPRNVNRGLQSASELVDEVGISQLLAPRKSKGLMFPWEWMNRKTYGMLPAELWVLAGHTSTGKTSAMLQHAVNAARHGTGVAIFSLEVGKEALFQKAVYQLARVDSERMKSGEPMTAEERASIRDATNEIVELPLYFDTTATTTTAIHAAMRRRTAKNKVGHVIVDYLQLLGNTGKSGNRAQEVGTNAWALKMLATDFKVPVLLLSQLSRESNKPGKQRRPELSDLKESGDIENHANGVWFIYRESIEDADQVSVDFSLPKQRDGRRNVYTDLWFIPKYQCFEEKQRD